MADTKTKAGGGESSVERGFMQCKTTTLKLALQVLTLEEVALLINIIKIIHEVNFSEMQDLQKAALWL